MRNTALRAVTEQKTVKFSDLVSTSGESSRGNCLINSLMNSVTRNRTKNSPIAVSTYSMLRSFAFDDTP